VNFVLPPLRVGFSLTQGFSPVSVGGSEQNRFNGFPAASTKPLKRFCSGLGGSTGLKPGVNETATFTRCRTLLLAMVLSVHCVGLQAQEASQGAPIRFRAVDVYVDSKDKPLAAYQLEFSVTNGNAKIVGIEGGGHPAFSEPPFYDPKAMQQERVILAAFSTAAADKLPTGKTRVATIHLQVSGGVEPKFELKLQTIAGSNGNKIIAEPSAEEREAK
jgi:hypothetical protein